MSTFNPTVSVCRHCQFYRTEGRRGGHCQQLGVPVQSHWKSCSFAIPPFTQVWQNPQGIAFWQGGLSELSELSDELTKEIRLERVSSGGITKVASEIVENLDADLPVLQRVKL
jgi:hypothetical protein